MFQPNMITMHQISRCGKEGKKTHETVASTVHCVKTTKDSPVCGLLSIKVWHCYNYCDQPRIWHQKQNNTLVSVILQAPFF